MDLRQCYEKLNGNLDEALHRLMKEDRIEKYLLRFVRSGEYEALCTAMEAKDYGEAFLHVHSLKGMSLNLSFTALSVSSSALCEALRGGTPTVDVTPLMDAVQRDYTVLRDAVREYAGEE